MVGESIIEQRLHLEERIRYYWGRIGKIIYKSEKMGNNIICCCHKCKVKIFNFRREEQYGVLPFYKKHAECAKEDINNVQSVMDNNGTDQPWAEPESNGGYLDDPLQEELRKEKDLW